MTAPTTPSPTFVVPVRDLDDGPKSLKGEISVEWLRAALESTEATPTEVSGQLELTLSKNGAEVLVRGHVMAPVIVPCARTLAPIHLELNADVLLLLHRTESATGKARERHHPIEVVHPRHARAARGSQGERPRDRAGKGRSAGHRPRGGWGEDPELSVHDAAVDTFEGEKIVLDPFVREFIILELPMFPVRQDLPSLPVDARASAPGSTAAPSGADDPASPKSNSIDPRLLPLAELKERLGEKTKK